MNMINKENRKQVRVAILQYGTIWLNDEDVNMSNEEILKFASENFKEVFKSDYSQVFIDNERMDYWYGYGAYKKDFSLEELAIMNQPYEMMMLNKKLQIDNDQYYPSRYCCHTIKDYMEE